MEQTSEFKGWAVVEIMGHNKLAGHVTTQAFGSNVMFRVHAPAADAVEQILDRDRYINYQTVPAGSKVRVSRPEFEQWVGVGSVYRMTPCSEEQALALLPQKIEVVELAERKALAAADEHDTEVDEPSESEGDF